MILTPPTDSLYKFCAIIGLVLFVYTGYFLLHPENDELNRNIHQLNLDESSIYAEVELLKFQMPHDTTFLPDKDVRKKLPLINFNNIDSTKYTNLIYSLPDKYSKKFVQLIRRKLAWGVRNKHLLKQKNAKELYKNIVLGLFGIGELICFYGGLLWYVKIQKPSDDELKKKYLREDQYEDCCQSCYKHFLSTSERGTTNDGNMSAFYCIECYANGIFTEPELDYETAEKRLKIKLKGLDYNEKKIKKLVKSFKGLLRWRGLRTW